VFERDLVQAVEEFVGAVAVASHRDENRQLAEHAYPDDLASRVGEYPFTSADRRGEAARADGGNHVSGEGLGSVQGGSEDAVGSVAPASAERFRQHGVLGARRDQCLHISGVGIRLGRREEPGTAAYRCRTRV